MKLTIFLAALLAMALALEGPDRAHAGEPPLEPVTSIEFDLITRTVNWTYPIGEDVDGFRLVYTTVGRRTNVVTYSAEDDARSFTLPDDAPRFLCRTSATIEIFAQRDGLESGTVSVDLPTICPPSDPAPTINFTMPHYAVSGPDASTYTITWELVPGAASYLLEGTLTIVRESVQGQCAEPIAHDAREVHVNEEFAAPATTYVLSLPALPREDQWVVLPVQTFVVSALDAYGEPIVAIGRAIVREGCGFGQPQVALPAAGSGRNRDLHLAWLVFALVTAGLGCASAHFGRLHLSK